MKNKNTVMNIVILTITLLISLIVIGIGTLLNYISDYGVTVAMIALIIYNIIRKNKDFGKIMKIEHNKYQIGNNHIVNKAELISLSIILMIIYQSSILYVVYSNQQLFTINIFLFFVLISLILIKFVINLKKL